MSVESRYFVDGCPLPPGLSQAELMAAMAHTASIISKMNCCLIDDGMGSISSLIQANNFSGIVSNILTKAISKHSIYQDNSDQAYPDLICEKNGGLEIKVSKDASKGGESHTGHAGWHLIASFVLIHDQLRWTCVKTAELRTTDWKYCGSTRNEATNSQRTENYTTNPHGRSKLLEGICYLDKTLVQNWKKWRISKDYAMKGCWNVWSQDLKSDNLFQDIIIFPSHCNDASL